MSFASFRPVAALVASAILGGVVAVGAVALLGGLDSGTTVVTETSAARSPGLAPADADGMSVHEIYERAASGRRACQLDKQLDRRRRTRIAADIGARLGLRHRQDRAHRHELPRRRGR